MSRNRNCCLDMFPCCLCGLFTVQPRQADPGDKYRVQEESVLEERSSRFTLRHPVQLENPAERFRRTFYQVADTDGEVDAYQLRDILNETFKEDLDFHFDGFSLEACRSMVALGDPDLSGQLRFREAEILFQELWKWKTVFKRFDTDKNGYFHSHEFHDLLDAIGFKFNDKSEKALSTRYTDRNGHVQFGDFVACMFKLTIMYEIFKDKTENRMDQADFCADEFIQMTLYS